MRIEKGEESDSKSQTLVERLKMQTTFYLIIFLWNDRQVCCGSWVLLYQVWVSPDSNRLIYVSDFYHLSLA